MIWAWLDYGSQPGITREQHRVYVPDRAVRVAARRQFATLASAEAFSVLECGAAETALFDLGQHKPHSNSYLTHHNSQQIDCQVGHLATSFYVF